MNKTLNAQITSCHEHLLKPLRQETNNIAMLERLGKIIPIPLPSRDRLVAVGLPEQPELSEDNAFMYPLLTKDTHVFRIIAGDAGNDTHQHEALLAMVAIAAHQNELHSQVMDMPPTHFWLDFGGGSGGTLQNKAREPGKRFWRDFPRIIHVMGGEARVVCEWRVEEPINGPKYDVSIELKHVWGNTSVTGDAMRASFEKIAKEQFALELGDHVGFQVKLDERGVRGYKGDETTPGHFLGALVDRLALQDYPDAIIPAQEVSEVQLTYVATTLKCASSLMFWMPNSYTTRRDDDIERYLNDTWTIHADIARFRRYHRLPEGENENKNKD